MKKTKEELENIFQSILDKYGEVESVNYWAVFGDYEDNLEEKLEETKDLKEIEDSLRESMWDAIDRHINENLDLEKDAIYKINTYLENGEDIGDAIDAASILKTGEAYLLEEVLHVYHNERMEILEKELSNDSSKEMEM